MKGPDFILFASQQSNLPQFHELMIYYSVNLTEAGGTQMHLVTHYFWVSVGVFLDEVNICISDELSKADSPPQCCGAPSDLSMA